MEPSILTQTLCWILLTIYIRHLQILLTPSSRVLLEKLTTSQLVKEFPHFMEPKGSIPHLQVPTICLYPEPDQSSPCPHLPLSEDNFNIIVTSTPEYSKWSLSIRFPCQNPVYTSPLPHTSYIPRLHNSSRFYHVNNIWWEVQNIKLFIM